MWVPQVEPDCIALQRDNAVRELIQNMWVSACAHAGHFQFLDSQSFLQQSVCASDRRLEPALRKECHALLLGWFDLCASSAHMRRRAASPTGAHTGQAVAASVESWAQGAVTPGGLARAVRVKV